MSQENQEVQYVYHRQMGNKILFRFREAGKDKTESIVIDDYSPKLYTVDSENASGFTNLDGNPLKEYSFDSIKDAKSFAERMKNLDIPVFGNSDFANQFVVEMYEGNPIQFDLNRIKYGAIDIEVDIANIEGFPHAHLADAPITVITIYNSHDDRYYVFGMPPDGNSTYDLSARHERLEGLDIQYMEYTNERELIRAFLIHMNDQQYDMVTGWNSENFDWPYIYHRSCKVVGETFLKKMLSPFNRINVKEMSDKYGNPFSKVTVIGLPHLDYMLAYQKFIMKKKPSYRLQDIAQGDLNEGKMDIEEGLRTLYYNDYHSYVDYNILDVMLLPKLEAKKQLIATAYAMMGDSLCNLEDTIGTVKIWDQMSAMDLYALGMAPPYTVGDKQARDFEGGFVKAPIPGIYKDVLSVDLNGLNMRAFAS